MKVLNKKINLVLQDSNTYNALVEVALLTDSYLFFDYENKIIKIISKEDSSFNKNFQLSPYFNLQEANLSLEGGSVFPILHVQGGEDDRGSVVGIVPFFSYPVWNMMLMNWKKIKESFTEEQIYEQMREGTFYKMGEELNNPIPSILDNIANLTEEEVVHLNLVPYLDSFLIDLEYFEKEFVKFFNEEEKENFNSFLRYLYIELTEANMILQSKNIKNMFIEDQILELQRKIDNASEIAYASISTDYVQKINELDSLFSKKGGREAEEREYRETVFGDFFIGDRIYREIYTDKYVFNKIEGDEYLSLQESGEGDDKGFTIWEGQKLEKEGDQIPKFVFSENGEYYMSDEVESVQNVTVEIETFKKGSDGYFQRSETFRFPDDEFSLAGKGASIGSDSLSLIDYKNWKGSRYGDVRVVARPNQNLLENENFFSKTGKDDSLKMEIRLIGKPLILKKRLDFLVEKQNFYIREREWENFIQLDNYKKLNLIESEQDYWAEDGEGVAKNIVYGQLGSKLDYPIQENGRLNKRKLWNKYYYDNLVAENGGDVYIISKLSPNNTVPLEVSPGINISGSNYYKIFNYFNGTERLIICYFEESLWAFRFSGESFNDGLELMGLGIREVTGLGDSNQVLFIDTDNTGTRQLYRSGFGSVNQKILASNNYKEVFSETGTLAFVFSFKDTIVIVKYRNETNEQKAYFYYKGEYKKTTTDTFSSGYWNKISAETPFYIETQENIDTAFYINNLTDQSRIDSLSSTGQKKSFVFSNTIIFHLANGVFLFVKKIREGGQDFFIGEYYKTEYINGEYDFVKNTEREFPKTINLEDYDSLLPFSDRVLINKKNSETDYWKIQKNNFILLDDPGTEYLGDLFISNSSEYNNKTKIVELTKEQRKVYTPYFWWANGAVQIVEEGRVNWKVSSVDLVHKKRGLDLLKYETPYLDLLNIYRGYDYIKDLNYSYLREIDYYIEERKKIEQAFIETNEEDINFFEAELESIEAEIGNINGYILEDAFNGKYAFWKYKDSKEYRESWSNDDFIIRNYSSFIRHGSFESDSSSMEGGFIWLLEMRAPRGSFFSIETTGNQAIVEKEGTDFWEKYYFYDYGNQKIKIKRERGRGPLEIRLLNAIESKNENLINTMNSIVEWDNLYYINEEGEKISPEKPNIQEGLTTLHLYFFEKQPERFLGTPFQEEEGIEINFATKKGRLSLKQERFEKFLLEKEDSIKKEKIREKNSTYRELIEAKNKKEKVWFELKQKYPEFLLEGYYTNETENDSLNLLKEAIENYKYYKKPEERYSLTYIDIEDIDTEDREVGIGDRISLKSRTAQKLNLSKNFQVTGITRELRNLSNIQIQVDLGRESSLLEKILNTVKNK